MMFTPIDVDVLIADKGGEIKRRYGGTLADALIAATALLTGSILVTHNIKDFERIQNLQIQRI